MHSETMNSSNKNSSNNNHRYVQQTPLQQQRKLQQSNTNSGVVVNNEDGTDDDDNNDFCCSSRRMKAAVEVELLELLQQSSSSSSSSSRGDNNSSRRNKERTTSSHAREFLAAALVVETFGDELRGKLVTFVTDNAGTASTFSTLSTSDPAAQQFCRRLGDACLRFDCDTAGMWQPREMNVVCDALSKLENAPRRAVWVAFSAEELESSTLDVGAGCLLVPRGRCGANGAHVGFIATAGSY